MSEKKIRLVVSGCCGRMGSLIIDVVTTLYAHKFELIGGLERNNHPRIGQPISDRISLRVSDDLKSLLRNSDLLIEFTTPDVSIAHALTAAEAKVPMLIGTTGFTKDQFDQLRLLSSHIPIFWSPNMSLGILAIRKSIPFLAKLFKKFGYETLTDADVKISEVHHKDKKDKPSGTAKQLAEDIAREFGESSLLIPIDAKREGSVIGIHTIEFNLGMERIVITHEATNRSLFALGAILWALHFTAFKDKPGWYTMDDIVSLALREKSDTEPK